MSEFSAYLTPSRAVDSHDQFPSRLAPASSPRSLSPIQTCRCAFDIASEWNSELASIGITPCLRAIAASSSVVDEGLECSGVEAALTALRQELRLAHATTRREAERANSCEVEAKRCKSQAAAAALKQRETDRAAAAAAERARIDVATAVAAAKKALDERDAEKKAAAVVKAREMRLEHEVRRLETHGDKVLNRLNALLMQKDRAQKSGIEISRTLQRLPGRDDGERENRWRSDTLGGGSSRLDDVHLLSKSVSVLEGRCTALADENTSLRFTLKQLQMELVDVLKAAAPPRSPAALTLTTRNGDTSLIDEAVFDLPFQLAGASIEEALRNKMRRLKLQLTDNRDPSSSTAPLSPQQSAAEAALLRDELAAALRTIGDQELTLRSLAAASSASATPSKLHARASATPGLSPGSLSYDEVQEEENRLERARRQLQRDRNAFTAAVERFEGQRSHLLGILSQQQPSHDALQAAVAFIASIAPTTYSNHTPMQRASGVWHSRGLGLPAHASSSPPQASSQKVLRYHEAESNVQDSRLSRCSLFNGGTPLQATAE